MKVSKLRISYSLVFLFFLFWLSSFIELQSRYQVLSRHFGQATTSMTMKGNSQGVEHSSFTWKIDNLSTLNADDLQSDAFDAGGHKWRIIIFPNNYKKSDFTVYIELADSETLPHGWTINAMYFRLSIINEDNGHTIQQEAKHSFDANETGWGFYFHMPFSQVYVEDEGLYRVKGTCIVKAEVWCNEQQKKGELAIKEKDSNPEKSSSSFAEFDTLFTDIQNLVEVKTSEAVISSRFSDKEIADAKTILKQCINMDLASFLQSGKAPELNNSLSIMLTTKFLAEFDERCENYDTAQRDLSEAQENEDSVGELKATLKRLSSKFMPVRNQAEAVDKQISRLESVLTAKKARLRKRLEDLAGQATASKQALVCAEQNLKLSSTKKEQAEKMVEDFQRSWASLKTQHESNCERETLSRAKCKWLLFGYFAKFLLFFIVCTFCFVAS